MTYAKTAEPIEV